MGEQRENKMDSALRKLRERAQLYVNLNREAEVLIKSILPKDKKKHKVLVEG